MVVAISCQKHSTPLTVEPSSISVYSGGTKQLLSHPAEGVTYSSADKYYAEVDENGLVTGNKVGNTNIIASSGNGTVTIPVTIMSQYSLYPELDPIVNSSKATMTNILGTDFTESTSDKGETVYTYKNYNTFTSGIVAIFVNGVCDNIGVLISTSHLTKFVSHLKERYIIAGMQNDCYFFLNHDKNVVITMALYNSRYMIALYTPYKGTRTGEKDILETYQNLKFQE